MGCAVWRKLIPTPKGSFLHGLERQWGCAVPRAHSTLDLRQRQLQSREIQANLPGQQNIPYGKGGLACSGPTSSRSLKKKKGFSALTEELQEPGGDGSSGCEHLTLGALRAVRAVPTLSGWRMKDGLHHSWDSTCRGVAAAGQRVKGPLSISEIPLKTRQSWKQPLSWQFLPRAATRTSSLAQQAGFRSDGIPASSRSPTLFPASSEAGASTALFTPLAPLYVGVGVSTTGSSC